MPEIKNTFAKGSMNKDLDERIIPVGQYRDALNIQIATSEGSDVGTAQNILGNSRVEAIIGEQFPGSRCVGAIADEKNDVLYWFVYGDTKDAIIEYHDDGTVTPVIVDINKDTLKFDFNDTITGINIIDDLLFWTDNRNEPRKINIKNCKLGTSNMNTHTKLFVDGSPVPKFGIDIGSNWTVTPANILDIKEEYIVVIKKKPSNSPKVIFFESTAQQTFSIGGFGGGMVPHVAINVSAFNNGSLPFVGDIISMTHTADVNHFDPFPIEVNDIVLLKSHGASGNLPISYEIKAKVDSWSGGQPPFWDVGAQLGIAQMNLEILEIEQSIPTGEFDEYYIIKEDDREVIFEQTFIRFATRYKYADGEYSAFSPFTQPVFLAGNFGFHPTKDPYNVGMQNKTISIKLQDLITPDTPKDVIQIDILFKKEDSTTVYSVDSIKWDDPQSANMSTNYWNSVNYSNYTELQAVTKLGDILPVNLTGGPTTIFHHTRPTGYRGEYTITTENIYAALPENQMLRPWDNVPRVALAQEITGNRLIYGNYLQNYTLKDFLGGKTNSDIDIKWEARNEDPSSYSFSGTTGRRSIKSNRTYQLGVVYGDKYGRETPVFTSVSGAQVVPVDLSNSGASSFLGAASQSLCLAAKLIGTQPDWAYYFKYYLKQTTGEYYNLTMDRVYKSTEDQNLWLSFPSSDRNKLVEGDYISIKKEVEQPTQVGVKNNIKVIDIKNEAPKSIKFDYVSLGSGGGSQEDLVKLFPDTSATPAVDVKRISIDKEAWVNDEYGADLDNISSTAKLSIQFNIIEGNTVIKSKQYHVLAWFREEAGVDGKWNLLLENTIHESDSWIESSIGVLNYADDLTITIYELQEKPAVEFEGRFFVKVISDPITQKYLSPHVGAVNDFQIVARAYAFWLADNSTTTNLLEQFVDNTTITYGVYNVTDWWLGNASGVNGVTSGGLGSAITETADGWHDVTKFNTSKRSNQGFFIDNMYMAAGQEDYNANTSKGFDAARSGRMWKGYAEDMPGVDGGWWINGLEGIVITDDSNGAYNSGLGSRNWSQNRLWENGIGDNFPQYDDTYVTDHTGGYGATVSGNAHEGCFMHLSYSSVGVDLHDGNFINWLIMGLMSMAPQQDSHLFRKNCQWIRAGSIKLNTTMSTSSSLWDEMMEALFGAGLPPVTGSDMNEHWAGSTIQTSTNWNDAADEAHDNQFNPAWSGGDSAKSVIARLETGSQFKFAGSSEIYTIKSVSTKYLYNHTSWNPMEEIVQTGRRWKGYDILNNGRGSVSEAYQEWVDAGYPDTSAESTIMLQSKIYDFGKANNRRVCYIIQLDKDPRNADAGFNPLNVADVNDFAAIQFIDEHIEPGKNLLPLSPAIFETEAKEDIDLNIYYEISDALPLRLDLTDDSDYPPNSNGINLNPDSTKGHVWAPIGSKISCNIVGSNPDLTWQNDTYPDYNFYVRVSEWDGNIVTLDSPGLRVNPGGQALAFTNNATGWSAQTSIYGQGNSGKLKFIREDLSYTQASIYRIKKIEGNYITKIEVHPELYNKYIGLSYYNCFSFGNGVESNRIRDDYNAAYIRHGVKASTVLEEPYEEERRKYGLIYSGLYNSTSGVNNLNQFIQAEKITKDLMPSYGSIQKLYARDKDLITLCEDRVLQVFVDKDVLYNADGNSQLLSTNRFLGTAEPFRGNYGISRNPESFAAESFRAYFTDKQRGAVLRLSMDGLTPISDYGMHDWFRDNLRDGGRLYGSYDTHKRNYNLTVSYPDGTNKLSNPDFDEGGTYLSTTSNANLLSNPVLENYTPAIEEPILAPEILQDGDMDASSFSYYPQNATTLIISATSTGATITVTFFPDGGQGTPWIEAWLDAGLSVTIISVNGTAISAINVISISYGNTVILGTTYAFSAGDEIELTV